LAQALLILLVPVIEEMAKMALMLAVALVAPAFGAVVHSHVALESSTEHIVALPMWMYKSDCYKSRPVAGLLQYVPGAGIKKFEAFKTVLKDGFMEIDCVKDYMFYHGDKFGDNKHDYKLEDVSNTSIVHYEAHVRKEDRKPMTQAVCFEFCRTVPNMGFFGLTNGRNCYCEPYYKQMAGDSSQCDAVCPGDNTMMCGGQAKSSVFALHNCESTQADLGESDGKATELAAEMDAKVKKATDLSKDMQKGAAALQKSFGGVGDAAAARLMQAAKESAGKLEHGAEDVDTLSTELKDLSKKAKGISNFKDAAEVTEAERIMENIDASVAKAAAATALLDKRIALASPTNDKEGSAKEYYPIMYFVDKKYSTMPSTCGGALVNHPIVGESADGCASACNDNFQTCVGFSYFAPEKLCFLFSKISTAFYYTGCKALIQQPAFLQQGTSKANPDVTCYAKLSKFEGTSLKPDGSGKCKQCLRKATKANRCFK